MEQRFFTLKQVCAKTGFSRQTLYNEKSRGKLIMRKAGGRTVILAEDFEQWIANFQVIPASRAA